MATAALAAVTDADQLPRDATVALTATAAAAAAPGVVATSAGPVHVSPV